jgi:hypothetical protein
MTLVAIIGLVIFTFIAGLFAYFVYLTDGAETKRR